MTRWDTSSGNDNALRTPRRATRGPNRGQLASVSSDPDRTVLPWAATLRHGRAFVQRKLQIVHRSDEVGTDDYGARATRLEQGHVSTLGAGDRGHRELGDLRQQHLQRYRPGDDARESDEGRPQLVLIGPTPARRS